LRCRPLLVTLACAAVGKLGEEGARRAKHVLERNTTLTELGLACEGVVFVWGGMVWGSGIYRRRVVFWCEMQRSLFSQTV